MRITRASRLLPPIDRGESLTISVDGEEIAAFAGETVATALLAAGMRVFGRAEGTDQPRGVYCAQGVCCECLVNVDGVPNVRACVTQVRRGMKVTTGCQPGQAEVIGCG